MELQRALQVAENEKECVTMELTFYRLVHQVEYKQNRQLYKVKISHQEKLDNLMLYCLMKKKYKQGKPTLKSFQQIQTC